MNVDDVLVEIGGANTMKEFTENLRGAKAGEERSFDVSLPGGFFRQAAGRQDGPLRSADQEHQT